MLLKGSAQTLKLLVLGCTLFAQIFFAHASWSAPVTTKPVSSVKNSAAKPETESLAKIIADGNSSIKEGDLARATRIFNQGAIVAPDDPRPYLGKARVLFIENKRQEAEKLLLWLRNKSPKCAELYYLLGSIYLSDKQPDKAKLQFEKAVSLNPNDDESHLRLAQLAQIKGAHERAGEESSRALRLNPRNVSARIIMSNELALSGRLDQAIEQLSAALKEDPENADLNFQLGSLLEQSGRSNEAVSKLKHAYTLDPKNPAAIKKLCQLYGTRNDWPNACDVAKIWTQIEPDNPSAHFMLGWALMSNRENTEAVAVLKHAVELDPANAHIRNTYGLVLLDQREADAALAQFKKTLGLAPDNLAAALNIGNVYISTSRWTEAIDWLRSLYTKKQDSAQVNGLFAYALAKSGQWEESKKLSAQALRNNPQELMAILSEGMAEIHAGNASKSIAMFRQAAQYAPNSPYALVELANALLKSGNSKESMDSAQQALQIAPSNLNAKAILAKAMRMEGNNEGAVHLLKECVARNPENLELRLLLAQSLESISDEDGAIKHYEAAHKQAPEDAAPLLGLYRIALKNNRLSEAATYALEATQANPHDLGAQLAVARTKFDKGKYDVADEICQAILRTDKDNKDANLIAGRIAYLQRRWNQATELLGQAIKESSDRFPDTKDRLQLAESALKSGQKSLAASTIEQLSKTNGLSKKELKNIDSLKKRLREGG